MLEYFDTFLIGLTATPNKQTFGFFRQNLVMEYDHPQAVVDGVNVDFDVYRIRTEITEQGSTVEAGYHVDRRDRRTRVPRPQQLEDDLTYTPGQLDRDVGGRGPDSHGHPDVQGSAFHGDLSRTPGGAQDHHIRQGRQPRRRHSRRRAGGVPARATTSVRRSPTGPPARPRRSCWPHFATATTRGWSSRST